jgi:hypothetical protein
MPDICSKVSNRMKLTNRGMFYSGLVFPGLGEWVLGRRTRGALLMAWELLLVLALALRVWVLVYNTLSEPLSHFQLPPELLAQVHKQLYVENWWLLVFIFGLWIASIIDAYVIGKKMESGMSSGRL